MKSNTRLKIIAYLRNARNFAGISFVRLIFSLLTAQKISVIKSNMDKNSCRNFTRLSAWWMRRWRKRKIYVILTNI